jgi:hypothetical protein
MAEVCLYFCFPTDTLTLRLAGAKKTYGDLCQELRNGVAVLEKFKGHIDHFVTWWNYMRMTADGQVTRTDMVESDYNQPRLTGIVRNWNDLKSQYADYSDQVRSFSTTSLSYALTSRVTDMSHSGHLPGPLYRVTVK